MYENERKRILDLLASGKVTSDEAERLINALGRNEAPPPANEEIVLKDRRGRKPKSFRVQVDAEQNSKDPVKVRINIPISVVRTLGPVIMGNLPEKARKELDKNGIDLGKIINDLEKVIDECSEQDIVNIDVEGEEGAKVRVYLE